MAKLQTTWSDLRAIEDPMPIDVTTLQEDLDSHKREIREKTNGTEEWKRSLEEINGRYQIEAKAFDDVQQNGRA